MSHQTIHQIVQNTLLWFTHCKLRSASHTSHIHTHSSPMPFVPHTLNTSQHLGVHCAVQLHLAGGPYCLVDKQWVADAATAAVRKSCSTNTAAAGAAAAVQPDHHQLLLLLHAMLLLLLLLLHAMLLLLNHSMPASLTAPDLTTTEKVASMRPIMELKVQNSTCMHAHTCIHTAAAHSQSQIQQRFSRG